MPIQTLSTSYDTNYLIGSSTSPETLQLIDSQQLKAVSNKKKKKGAQRGENAFFADLESNAQQDVNEQEQESDDESDTDDDEDDSDEEIRKPPKKKKKRVHSWPLFVTVFRHCWIIESIHVRYHTRSTVRIPLHFVIIVCMEH